jgi:hypothetical protein
LFLSDGYLSLAEVSSSSAPGNNNRLLPRVGSRMGIEPVPNLQQACALGYSEFHNLMGFTSKKLPNNIL